jgi:parallel beta-helix repeat protein
LVLGATLLHAEGVLAKTFVVSNTGINCYPQVAGPLYPTIKAALAAVPIAANAAHVVMVCPGTYPEQVKITKNVSITGVLRDGTDPVEILGNSGDARIVPPAGGLLRDPDFLGNVAAQVYAQNITDLNLTNLHIDGTDIGCPLGTDGAPMTTAGIALYGVGIPDTAHKATISKSVLHNQVGVCGGVRSYTGHGVRSEKSWTALDANSLSNADNNLVHQIEGVSKITNNWLSFSHYGILLSNVKETFGANLTGSTISSNTITALQAGILLEGSSHVLISLNTLSHTGIGTDALSSDNEILSNKVIDAWYGIWLGNGTSRTIVRSNTVVRSVRVGIVDQWSEGGNTITGNTINQAPIGIFFLNVMNDVINPNTYFNVTVLTTTGPSVP